MVSSYPTIVSDRLVSTVNFYEDYFDFVPTIEQDGYVLLKKGTRPDACIAVYDPASKACKHATVLSGKGVIVNIVEEDVKAKFDALYMEGIEIAQDLAEDINGNEHFIVYDPNGIMVNVHAPMTLS